LFCVFCSAFCVLCLLFCVLYLLFCVLCLLFCVRLFCVFRVYAASSPRRRHLISYLVSALEMGACLCGGDAAEMRSTCSEAIGLAGYSTCRRKLPLFSAIARWASPCPGRTAIARTGGKTFAGGTGPWRTLDQLLLTGLGGISFVLRRVFNFIQYSTAALIFR
jgi:hypothetical protein